MMIKQTFSRIYKRFWFHKRYLQNLVSHTAIHYWGYSSDQYLSHILHLFGYTGRYMIQLAWSQTPFSTHKRKKDQLQPLTDKLSQIYLSQETKTCPKSPKLRAVTSFTNSGSKGTGMMNRRLKTINLLKVKEEEVGHFLQLATSVIYNNYTYIYIYTPL